VGFVGILAREGESLHWRQIPKGKAEAADLIRKEKEGAPCLVLRRNERGKVNPDRKGGEGRTSADIVIAGKKKKRKEGKKGGNAKVCLPTPYSKEEGFVP